MYHAGSAVYLHTALLALKTRFSQACLAILPAQITEGQSSICFLLYMEKAFQAEGSAQHIRYLLIASKLHCDLSHRDSKSIKHKLAQFQHLWC